MDQQHLIYWSHTQKNKKKTSNGIPYSCTWHCALYCTNRVVIRFVCIFISLCVQNIVIHGPYLRKHRCAFRSMVSTLPFVCIYNNSIRFKTIQTSTTKSILIDFHIFTLVTISLWGLLARNIIRLHLHITEYSVYVFHHKLWYWIYQFAPVCLWCHPHALYILPFCSLFNSYNICIKPGEYLCLCCY